MGEWSSPHGREVQTMSLNTKNEETYRLVRECSELTGLTHRCTYSGKHEQRRLPAALVWYAFLSVVRCASSLKTLTNGDSLAS